MKKVPDELDRRLVGLLARDGRMSVGDIANCLRVSAPTIRSRIKSLEQAGLLKNCRSGRSCQTPGNSPPR